MISEPDRPLRTWSEVEPCLCGWYQWVPGAWFQGSGLMSVWYMPTA